MRRRLPLPDLLETLQSMEKLVRGANWAAIYLYAIQDAARLVAHYNKWSSTAERPKNVQSIMTKVPEGGGIRGMTHTEAKEVWQYIGGLERALAEAKDEPAAAPEPIPEPVVEPAPAPPRGLSRLDLDRIEEDVRLLFAAIQRLEARNGLTKPGAPLLPDDKYLHKRVGNLEHELIQASRRLPALEQLCRETAKTLEQVVARVTAVERGLAEVEKALAAAPDVGAQLEAVGVRMAAIEGRMSDLVIMREALRDALGVGS